MIMSNWRKGGAVKRWHTHSIIQEQTVASHSWGVALILLKVIPSDKISVTLLSVALLHDVAEGETGDIPYTAKKQWPDLGKASLFAESKVNENNGITQFYDKLSAQELLHLKIADMMELMFYLLEERKLGNKNLDHIMPVAVEVTTKLMGPTIMFTATMINFLNLRQTILEEYEHVCK